MNENNNNNNQSLSSFYGNEEIDNSQNNQPVDTNNQPSNNVSMSEMYGNPSTPEEPQEPVQQETPQEPVQSEQSTPEPEQSTPEPEQPNKTNNVTGTDIKAAKAFVGENYQNFVNGGFNIGAFFFGPLYYFYRKMYLYGFILLIIEGTLSPLALIIRIVCGFITNGIYLNFVSEKVKELSSQYSGDELINQCKQKGGTSNIAIIIAIALLLFIPILGIFMIVGIPATQRTINNSRKDTFVDTAKEYANAVKTAWAADEIKCGGTNAQSLSEGYYYIYFKTGGEIEGVTDPNAETNTKNLISTELKSPWGNANLGGYVKVEVPQNNASMTKYKILVVDEKDHGIIEEETSDTLTRAHVRDIAILPEPSPYSYTQSSVVTCTVE